MLRIGLIGIGNAGNQVLVAAKEVMPDVDSLAINCSTQDLETLPSEIKKMKIGDGGGAGKDRAAAKKFLKESFKEQTFLNNEVVLEFMKNIDFVFIISSTGGGSGSGTSLVLSKIISKAFPFITVVSVGILPTLKEGLSAQANSIEYLDELYTKMGDHTYMMYDNNKLQNLKSYQVMDEINMQIARDLNVLRGYYNVSTKYSSIDDKESSLLLRTPGRIVVSSLYDINERESDDVGLNDFENQLLCAIKKNGHAEMQNDRIINRLGVITNLSQNLFEKFDTTVPQVQKVVGTPVEIFEHIKINEDRKLPNNIFMILAGATKINERIIKINDRIDEILKAQEEDEDDSELNTHNVSSLNDKKHNRVAESTSGSVNVTDIFDDFGV